MLTDVNLVSVLLAAMASMAVGFLWYGALFQKTWLKLMGKTEAEMKANSSSMGMMYGLSFVAAAVEAYVLSMFLGLAGATTPMEAVTTAFWAWLGFVATTMWLNYMYGGKSTNLYLLDTAHHLAAVVVMSVVLVSVG